MKNVNVTLGLGVLFLALITTLMGLMNHMVPVKNDDSYEVIDSLITFAMEKSYFEGQKDCLNGDIRISRKITGTDTVWSVTKSFWNSGRPTIFNPEQN